MLPNVHPSKHAPISQYVMYVAIYILLLYLKSFLQLLMISTIYKYLVPYELLQKMVEKDLYHSWTSFLE